METNLFSRFWRKKIGFILPGCLHDACFVAKKRQRSRRRLRAAHFLQKAQKMLLVKARQKQKNPGDESPDPSFFLIVFFNSFF